MGGEDDGRLSDCGDFFDRAHSQPLHVLHHALIVHDLSQDCATAAARGESLHFQIGDPHAGAETVLLGAFDFHCWPERPER